MECIHMGYSNMYGMHTYGLLKCEHRHAQYYRCLFFAVPTEAVLVMCAHLERERETHCHLLLDSHISAQ
jgi:hypothetical protein